MAEPSNRYGLTAARQHDRPGREARPRGTTIDMHSHVLVPAAAEFVRPHLPPANPRMQFATEETRILGRKQDEDRTPNLTDLTLRMRDFDGMGLDAQIISPAPGQCYYQVAPEIGSEAARMINDGIAAIAAEMPERIPGALGTVALQAADAAVTELERCMTTLGFKGVEVLAHVNDKELSDPDFAPFWAKAEQLGAVVFIHPSGFTEPRRFGRYYFNNIIGNPLDTTMALHHLIFDGVLERHPNLKIVAAHGGGFLPAYSGRIDHGWGARSDAHGELPKPPSTYLKQIYFDTIVFTPHQLEALVKLFGADHLLLGTDYPYDMGEYDPLGHIAATPGLSDADRAAIAGGNAKRLFGL